LSREVEHPLQRSQFSIDRRVRSFLFLPLSDVTTDSIPRDLDGPKSFEELLQMADTPRIASR
jgi:hypothetical protein